MNELEPTAVSYARTDQDDGQRSWERIARQHQVNSESARRLGIHVVASFFDLGQPGDTTNRLGVNDLLRHVEDRPVDYAVVSSIDRLADKAEQLNYLLLRLKRLGVNVLMADQDTVIELVLPSDLEAIHSSEPRQEVDDE